MHYDWEALAHGVYRCRLPFLDVTVGLVAGTRGILLVDCGTTLLEAAQIADDVFALTGGSVTHVVLTHHHFDHILGSAGFGAAQIYAPPAVAAALTTHLGEVRAHALEYGTDPVQLDRAISGVRAPDQIVTNTDLDLGGRSVHVEHPGPGHTDHDLVVVVPARSVEERTVVFCGDLVEQSADPAINEGSDVGAWPSALDGILALGGPDAIYVPGHGALVDAAFVRRQRAWLAARGESPSRPA
ncbi:MBL fold metallo-hydrolase [Mycolicibacterium sp. CH28]|uniref:MBL fold metallo-hydrolase n=1 Tax=Mycolicibacterium sp. CH28 TaxID=2512237 RepID=UPI001081809F|nr:MBL fold metallo-hydrolase [Mycolicibacterium sp. CH28]TGD88489.1 MBL fold metallo-hydrolase [Mycolicibacterium sp. CH28]